MNPSESLLLAGALWATVGCTKEPNAYDRPDRTGVWFAVDPHVHSHLGSNDAGHSSSIETIASTATERDLALVIITDHSNSAGSMDCPTGDVEDCSNQGPEFPASDALSLESTDGVEVHVGVEISPVHSLEPTATPTGHIGCLPTAPDSFESVTDPVIDRPAGTVPGGDGVDWCHNQGGFAVVNHPYSIAGWLNYDWSSMNYDAIEVFNGSGLFDGGDWHALQAWACDVAKGRKTVPLGGSDTHEADTPTPPPDLLSQSLGYPTTWVRAQDQSSIMAALLAGHTVVSDPSTTLDATAWTEHGAVGPGEQLKTDGTPFSFETTATVAADGLVLEILDLHDEACASDSRESDGLPPTLDGHVLFSTPLEAGEPFTKVFSFDPTEATRLSVWIRPDDPSMMRVLGPAVAAPIHIVP